MSNSDQYDIHNSSINLIEAYIYIYLFIYSYLNRKIVVTYNIEIKLLQLNQHDWMAIGCLLNSLTSLVFALICGCDCISTQTPYQTITVYHHCLGYHYLDEPLCVKLTV